ncbi:gamma-glutamylcyclotransferase [Flavihumibacter rivuli]|uniref:gamma-glutamylcyclotransferase family protein n=1 Tax=Flavihumibacter rivuli TaxID=2838156 RepID=UPI001BDF54A8|nr:gamma-glutamylcyclotransferase family protein [Flavihumibacter rivuli]ULQ55121.1 gamma-glutamylcyclotransferase [Flavihumibacter rivuli]
MEHYPDQQLFVYGSLRKGFQHPAYEYIRQYFDFVADARVNGLLYDMGEYPAAIPADTDKTIIGELYVIRNADEFDWAIAQLDDYEGVDPEEGDEKLYRREQAVILLPDGSQTWAWIYWFNGDVSGKPIVESGDVLQYLADKLGRRP